MISSKEGRLELIQLTILKYFIKRCLKKKKSFEINEKIWYFGKINFFIQKKSKNSRMGKGKGILERGVIRLKKNFIIFEFEGYSLYRLKKFVLNVNKKINLNFFLFFINKKTYNLWCKNNKYIYYFDKYLIY